MKKITLLAVITAATALSATAFAGQGFYIEIHNNLSYPIQYESIAQNSWHHDDIPWNWITITAGNYSFPLYTERLIGGFDAPYITVGIESGTGTKIGAFQLCKFIDSQTLHDWNIPNTTSAEFGPTAGDDWYLTTGSFANEPTISGSTNDIPNPDVVDITIG
ncbi:MAG: hypothetical protein NTX05_08995 [Fusobacteria bacterium]|nr:hypothetical protein [Fusobacteriota bacterium]